MALARHEVVGGIETDLAAVEDLLHDVVHSAAGWLGDIAEHLITAGGKRLRPSLVLLAARASSDACDQARLTRAAATTELIHLASLLHDDVLDKADLRRGRQTAHRRWGNNRAILCGDYLLAVSSAMLASDGDLRVVRVLCEATMAMVRGEARESSPDRVNTSVHEALLAVRGKTAAFTRACARVGALVAGADEDREGALARYGLKLGMAFQVVDDLLDLMAEPSAAGKSTGTDLRAGKCTLPLVLALRMAPVSARRELQQALARRDGDANLTAVRRTCQEVGAVAEARRIAGWYADRAVAQLAALPPSPARDGLQELARFVVEREK